MVRTEAVEVVRLPHADGLPLPSYAHEGDAGMDLCAAVLEPVVLLHGAPTLIPTGLRVGIPAGFEIQIRSRSGLALKHGVVVRNSPGTLDASFRGEVGVILVNTGAMAFTVERGMRIAQAVLAPVIRAAWVEVDELDATARGAGGFGSSGVDVAAPPVMAVEPRPCVSGGAFGIALASESVLNGMGVAALPAISGNRVLP